MSEEIALASADLATVTQLREQVGALSLQVGSLNTTIGYQDAMLRRAAADAGWLRGLVMRAITHLDSYGEIGTPIAAMAEDLEVMLARTGDAGAALLTELEAARALAAYLNNDRHWVASICPTCGFGRKLTGEEFHGASCPLAAYNAAAKGVSE